MNYFLLTEDAVAVAIALVALFYMNKLQKLQKRLKEKTNP